MTSRRLLLQNPALLGFLLAFFFVLRIFCLLQPHLFTFDEGVYSALGFQLRHSPTNYSTATIHSILDRFGPHQMEYLNRPLFKQPPVYPMMIALSYRLLGCHVFAALLPTLLAWVGICLMTRKIATELFGPAVGFIAYCLVLIDPMGWALSMKIFSECLLAFLSLWGLWLYLRNFRSGSLFLCGAVLGLGCLVKYQTLIYLGTMFLHLGILRSYKKMPALGISFGLVVTPWVITQAFVYRSDLWTRVHGDFFMPNEFLAKIGILAIFCYIVLQPLLARWNKSGLWERPLGSRLTRWVLFLLMAIPVGLFANRAIGIFQWDSLPLTSFLWDFSDVAGFYFFQPLLFLPFLILVPLSPLCLAKPENPARIYLIFTLIALFFIMATFWQNPQIRYIYPVVPLLIILAAATGRELWEKAFSRSDPVGRIAQVAIACLALFFFAKTLRNDWFFGFVNQAGRF